MAITLGLDVQITSYASHTDTSVNKPTSTTTDDVVVFALYIDDSSPTVTLQAGFTAIANISRSGGDTMHLYTCYRIASAGDGSTYTPWTHASALSELKAYRLTGVNTSSVLDGTATTNQGTGPATTLTGLTTSYANSALIGVTCNYSGGAQAPTGSPALTERSDGGQVWLGDEARASAGSTGNRTTSCTDNDWLTILFALREQPTTSREQEGYRWRNDNGSETTATWKANQDTALTAPENANTRLRVLVNATGDPATTQYQLEYKKETGGTYRKVLTADAYPVVATSNTTIGTSGSSVSVNMPASISAGDLLLIFATNDSPGATNMAVSGWTSLYASAYTGDVIKGAAWAKIAVGGDTATLTGAAQDIAIVSVRVTGHGVTTIASDIKVGTTASGSSATPDPPSLDAGSSAAWLWIECAHSDDDDNTSPYVSSGYTAIAQAESAQSTSSCMTSVGYLATTAQTENPGTMALAATEEWLANVIAIPPYREQITMSASANISASGEATTAQLTAPSGKTTGDFVTGRMQDDENPADTIDITTDDYTELEWCLIAVNGVAVTNDNYYFRVTAAGTVLDTYTVTPLWTIGTAGTTVDLSSLPASVASSAVNPTVILGSLSLNLSSVPAAAAATAVDPTVILGSQTLNLAAVPASVTATAVDPTVIAGSLTLNLASLPASAAGTAVDPTVILGSLSLDLSTVPAAVAATAVDPTVSISNPGIDLASVPATVTSSAVDPTVILGSLSLDLSTAPASAAATAVNPTVILGSQTIDLSAVPATAAATAIDPTVIYGSLSLDLSSVPASVTASAVNPTVILGSQTIDLSSVPASVTSSAVDPSVSLGGALYVDVSGEPASVAATAVNPTVILGSLSLDLSSVPATAAASAVNPTVIYGSLSLDLSTVPASVTASAVNPTVIYGSVTVDLSGLPAAVSASAVDPTIILGSLSLNLAAVPATVTTSAVDPTVLAGLFNVPGLWLVWSEPAAAWLIWSEPAAAWLAWSDTAAAWRYWLDPQEARL